MTLYATTENGAVTVHGYLTRPHVLQPDEARDLARQLERLANEADTYEEFDATPGTLYRDADGDRALFVVVPDPWSQRASDPALFRIPFDEDETATWANKSYWERETGHEFVSVKAGSDRPLNISDPWLHS